MSNGHDELNSKTMNNAGEAFGRPGLPPRPPRIDHEEKGVLADVSSCPNSNPPEAGAGQGGTGRPVTPTAPTFSGGARWHGSSSQAGQAEGVPTGVDTHVAGPVGAAFAPPSQASQAQPGMAELRGQHGKFVIEEDNASDEINVAEGDSTTQLRDFEEICAIDGAQAAQLGTMDAQAFAAQLKEGGDYITRDQVGRNLRKNTAPSPATREHYRKKYETFREVFAQSSGTLEDGIKVALGRYAASRNSFKVMRSAVKFTLKMRLIDLFKEGARIVAEGSSDPERMRTLASHVRDLLSKLEIVDRLNRSELLEALEIQPQHLRSKRRQLAVLDEGWRDRFLFINEQSQTYCNAGVLLRFCGMRPVELEQGVAMTVKGSKVYVQVQGGKVRVGVAGQPARAFALDAATLPERFVAEVRRAGWLTVKADADALRAHLQRLTPAVLQGAVYADEEVCLSAYLFRHALVTDLRVAGWEEAEIAGFIGERSEETAKAYGLTLKRGARWRSKVAVDRSTVRLSELVKLRDKKGLDGVLAKKASKKSKGKSTGLPRR